MHQLVEVHGNDGTSHKTVAKHWVEKNIPGSVVVQAQSAGIRCRHGHIVWDVKYELSVSD